VRDNGKPLPEAQWDIGDAIGCFRYYAGLARNWTNARTSRCACRRPLSLPYPPRTDRRGRADHPWNYPLLMAAWKVAPAWRPAPRWC
jgi:betaine-aldehyde dehydrogenase